jgi:hypothetical protein
MVLILRRYAVTSSVLLELPSPCPLGRSRSCRRRWMATSASERYCTPVEPPSKHRFSLWREEGVWYKTDYGWQKGLWKPPLWCHLSTLDEIVFEPFWPNTIHISTAWCVNIFELYWDEDIKRRKLHSSLSLGKFKSQVQWWTLPKGAIENKRTRMLNSARMVKARLGVNAAPPWIATYAPNVANDATGVTPSCNKRQFNTNSLHCNSPLRERFSHLWHIVL